MTAIAGSVPLLAADIRTVGEQGKSYTDTA
jgi:hypothetical protein